MINSRSTYARPYELSDYRRDYGQSLHPSTENKTEKLITNSVRAYYGVFFFCLSARHINCGISESVSDTMVDAIKFVFDFLCVLMWHTHTHNEIIVCVLTNAAMPPSPPPAASPPTTSVANETISNRHAEYKRNQYIIITSACTKFGCCVKRLIW